MEKNQSPALGAFITAAIVAGVSLAALVAADMNGYERPRRRVRSPGSGRPLKKPEADWMKKPDLSHLAEKGWDLLEKKYDGEQTLDAYLGQKYLGLYLIGRAETQVPDNRREAIAADLRHFHHQLDRPTDWAIVGWYETLGVSQSTPLSKLLQACPEIVELKVDPRYIAFAFGEAVHISVLDSLVDIEGLKERGLIEKQGRAHALGPFHYSSRQNTSTVRSDHATNGSPVTNLICPWTAPFSLVTPCSIGRNSR